MKNIKKVKVKLQEVDKKIFDKNIDHTDRALTKLFAKRDRLLEKLEK